MVTVLPPTESFGAAFGRALGGVAQSAAKGWADRQQEQAKIKRFQDIINPKQAPEVSNEDIKQKFLSALPEIEQNMGRELTPQDLDQIWQRMQPQQMGQALQGKQQSADPMAQYEAGVAAGLDKPYLDVLKTRAEFGQKEKELETKGEQKREAQGESELLAINNRLRSERATGMRFNRLNQLFSPELESQFPPGFLVGLLSKDGELRPTFSSQISPEAQESVKLIADELGGAKDSFGARVTNFDLQAYMKRLPTLLNSPEGRRRVLRDLQIMNEMNRMHDQGILDIIDRYGGPGKISISKAERIFDKENATKIDDLTKEFVNPEKAQFSDFPSASRYKGRTLEDPETKQKFRSDGENWIPLQ